MEEVTLVPDPPALINNVTPEISFSPVEVEMPNNQISNTVILKFSGGRPPVSDIQKHIQQTWRLKGDFTTGLLGPRHIIVRLASEVDLVSALARESHMINSCMYRIFRWSPDFNFKKDSPFVAVWIRLPKLPLHYFVPWVLKRISDGIGSFLRVDDRTLALTHLMFARVCIEVDVTKELPWRIWIGTSIEKGFWQKIEYEGNIRYCSGCDLLGHVLTECRKGYLKKTMNPPPRLNDEDQEHGDAGKPPEENGGKGKGVVVQQSPPSIIPALVETTVKDIHCTQVSKVNRASNCSKLKDASGRQTSTEVKLNVDGSSRDGQCTGGGVIRDGNGAFIIAFSNVYGPGSSMRAEILALRDGLLLCRELCLYPMLIESDSLHAVQVLVGSMHPPWSRKYFYDLRQCKELLGSYTLRHVHREMNKPADRLAAFAHSIHTSQQFNTEDALPRDVRVALTQDSYDVYSKQQ